MTTPPRPDTVVPIHLRNAPSRLDRRGLNLVELLVVIAIFGVLIALLLPAVSAQRETARRTQCASRLKQVGVGLQAYYAAYSEFPSGLVADVESGVDSKSWGWGALLLPFIEEQTLADRLNPAGRPLNEVVWEPELEQDLRTSVTVYRCPSDQGDELSHRYRSMSLPLSGWEQVVGSGKPKRRFAASMGVLAHIFPTPPPPSDRPAPPVLAAPIARSNYIASIGSRWKPARQDWSEADFEGDGLFGRNSEVKHAEITDGASHTLAVGERCDRNYAAVWAGGNSWRGCGFTDNQMVLGTAFYPINQAPAAQNIDCDGQGSANYSSYHPGGVNSVFADGSVHFLAEETDPLAFRRLARRDDGEAVDDF
ncbi:MAG: DUF1559 domain-containing protein [Planctomycetota bacterium]